MNVYLIAPYPYFTEIDGSPLDAGKIYLGEQGEDAETYPIQAYWDSALTIPATQPIRTIGGYPARDGAISSVFTADPYSITVRDSRDVLVYSALLTNELEHVSATEAHGAVGAVVGTENTQTLENKTLVAPIIDDLTNMQHDHSDAANGGIGPKILVSDDDTNPSHLGEKLVAGTGISITSSGPGTETLTISGAAINRMVNVSIYSGSEIAFTAGTETADNSPYANILLAAQITKRLDSVWVAGSGNGGRASATNLTGANTFHYFVISKADGTSDAGFDTSLTATNLLADATDYVNYCRVASIPWTGSVVIPFKQYGERFLLVTPVLDRALTVFPTTAQATTLSTPTGKEFDAMFSVYMQEDGSSSANPYYCIISNSVLGDIAPSSTVWDVAFAIPSEIFNKVTHASFVRPTNASAQITARFDNSTGNTQYSISTRGWFDRRR